MGMVLLPTGKVKILYFLTPNEVVTPVKYFILSPFALFTKNQEPKNQRTKNQKTKNQEQKNQEPRTKKNQEQKKPPHNFRRKGIKIMKKLL